MRPKSLLLLALALGCGLVASIGISQVMDRNVQSASQARNRADLRRAAQHQPGRPDRRRAWCRSQEWPKDKVPRGAISKLEELEGRRPRTAIIEGEPILEGKLLAPGQIADPISSIPKGMRLKTIAVDAEKSAAGLLGPGDRVDVQLFVRKDRTQRHRDGQVESHPAEHPRVRRRPDRAALAGWRRRTHDRQDGFADADARAGQQADAGRADRRGQPDSAQPGR